MLYAVEFRRARESLATAMSEIREWLDRQRFEPSAFRCATDQESARFRLEFAAESEAAACADAFSGQLSSIGDRSTRA